MVTVRYSPSTCLLFLCATIIAMFMFVWPVYASRYPDPKLPQGNVTVLATAQTKRFIHVFGLGSDPSILWHKYVDLQDTTMTWSKWLVRGVAENGTWEGDPCTGVNVDGTVEVFIRYSTGLDLWQIYQLNSDDPQAWSEPRECTCPTAPDCPSDWDVHFWNTQPVFPTSDCQVVPDPADGRLQVYIRGFTGEYFRVKQRAPSAHNYMPPENFGQSSLME